MTQWMIHTKEKDFYWCGIHKLSEIWGKCITTDGVNFEESSFYQSFFRI